MAKQQTTANEATDTTAEIQAQATQDVAPLPKREPLPKHIDLGEPLPQRTITVPTLKGERVDLHPVFTSGGTRRATWYQNTIERLEHRIAEVTDKKEMRELEAERDELEHEQLQLMIPDMPAGLLGDLDITVYRQLNDTVTQLFFEATGIQPAAS